MSRLITTRLLLRPFEEADSEAVTAYRSDARVMRYLTGAPETAEEIQGFLDRARSYALQQPQSQFRFAVVLAETGRVVGGCGLDITDREGRDGEIGYHFHPDFWGRGLGAEVAIELLRFGFEDLALHRIFADCVAENLASARVMQKAGMQQEGYFRENKQIAGRWHDTLLYAILDWEWKTQQAQKTPRIMG